ncbi:MAG: Geranylgeranyl pyrophosphate synthase [Parcubacteria group bacterium GW2011_GWA2_31_28]|nr:MAG: Geranylgeranyl pyrophosphate synthase [Parcubacteria group bacterium GW2011_GWA2_31_28]
MFSEYLKKEKIIIDSYLLNFLGREKPRFSKINIWGKDAIAKIGEFSVLGKTIRGTLVMLSAEMFGYKNSDPLVILAGGIELIHTSLLIHDDIMDEDLKRRGIDTIFASYLPIARINQLQNQYLFAQSMGICVGDMGFFLFLKSLNMAKIPADIKTKIIEKISDEIIAVGLGQMQDIYLGQSQKNVDEKDIMNVYLRKTARYTFSLPLALGSMLADQKTETILELERLGEYLGLIFQIKDDEIGLFSKISGKPLGSDIRKNKKTLIRYYLFDKAGPEDKLLLKKTFGNPKIKNTDIEKVQKLASRYHIHERINATVTPLVDQSKKIIHLLKISSFYKNILLDLLDQMLIRNK